jgi:hypothetical protein
MPNFNIVTFCSKNYYPRLLKTINSWYNQSYIKNIFVYTDFLITQNSDKIIYKKLFEESEDFGENCSRKALSIQNFLRSNFDNALFLDVDCMIIKDLNSLFDESFDIAVTIYPEIKIKYQTNNISSGFIAFKNSINTGHIIDSWVNIQDKSCKESPCRDQKSLSETISKIIKDKQFKIKLLNSNIWNSHPSTGNIGHIKEWYKRISENKPHLLHFSSGSIDHQEIIDEALYCLENVKNVE